MGRVALEWDCPRALLPVPSKMVPKVRAPAVCSCLLQTNILARGLKGSFSSLSPSAQLCVLQNLYMVEARGDLWTQPLFKQCCLILLPPKRRLHNLWATCASTPAPTPCTKCFLMLHCLCPIPGTAGKNLALSALLLPFRYSYRWVKSP